MKVLKVSLVIAVMISLTRKLYCCFFEKKVLPPPTLMLLIFSFRFSVLLLWCLRVWFFVFILCGVFWAFWICGLISFISFGKLPASASGITFLPHPLSSLGSTHYPVSLCPAAMDLTLFPAGYLFSKCFDLSSFSYPPVAVLLRVYSSLYLKAPCYT